MEFNEYQKAANRTLYGNEQVLTICALGLAGESGQLIDLIQDYMITDMSKSQYLKIAMDGLDGGSLESDDFYTVPGTGETTETYDVYKADRQAIIPILLNLFYREE